MVRQMSPTMATSTSWRVKLVLRKPSGMEKARIHTGTEDLTIVYVVTDT